MTKRGGLRLAALLAPLLLAACAVTPNSDVSAFAESSGDNSFEVFDRNVDADAFVLPVVHDRQTQGPSCGAHALASVVNYWRGAGTVAGEAIFSETPPADEAGYSMAELMRLAQSHRIDARSVRLNDAAIRRELEAGRPVLVPVRLPSIYVQQRSLPGGRIPVVGPAVSVAQGALMYRAGRVSEWTRLALIDHYVLIVGYADDRYVVVEPVYGYRTISADKLGRYRDAFGDAAMVFSREAARPRARRR